jgi:inner membrane protein
MMVGIATTLAITRPDTVPKLIMAAGVGAVGSLISDIDVGTSASHKEADRVVALTAVVAGVALVAECFGNAGIIDKVMQSSGLLRIIIGIIVFVVTCAFGKEQPHRSFMHSFLALMILDCSLLLMYPPIVPYFTVGFLSHIATDIFNKRKVRLLYPLKGGFSLNLFHANGVANTIFFVCGCILTAVEVVLFVARVI